MSNNKFNLTLNIFNFILTIFLLGIVILFYILLFGSGPIHPYCVIILPIIVKLFFFPSLYKMTKKIFKNTKFKDFLEELIHKDSRKLQALLSAILYDVIVIICVIVILLSGEDSNSVESVSSLIGGFASIALVWEMLTAGGVVMFYFSLLYTE